MYDLLAKDLKSAEILLIRNFFTIRQAPYRYSGIPPDASSSYSWWDGGEFPAVGNVVQSLSSGSRVGIQRSVQGYSTAVRLGCA